MTQQRLREIVSGIAKTALIESDRFEDVAKIEAASITMQDLPYLQVLLHNSPPLPADIDARDLGLGQWLAVCQYAVFELVYHLGADALDYVRSVAFGEYDWPQASALEVLCRLCVDGKIDGDIIREIDTRLCEVRFEACLYFARGLLRRSKTDKRFADIVNQFKSVYFYYALADLGENMPTSNEDLIDLVKKINTYTGDDDEAGMLKEIFYRSVAVNGHTLMTKDDLVALGKRITTHDGTEEEVQMLMVIFDRNVPYPQGSGLFYYPENYNNADDLSSYNPTVEEIVEKCLSYKPITL